MHSAATHSHTHATQSAKPLRRIEVEEIGSSGSEDETDRTPKAAPPQPATSKLMPVDTAAPALVRELQKQHIHAAGPVKTAAQFESAWKAARGDGAEQAVILQVRPCSAARDSLTDCWQHLDLASVPAVLKAALDANLLVAIAGTVQHHFVPQHINPLPLLLRVARVARFPTILMFLEREAGHVPLFIPSHAMQEIEQIRSLFRDLDGHAGALGVTPAQDAETARLYVS